MDKQLTISSKFKYITFSLMAIGVIAIVYALVVHPERFWANYLLNNYYFLTVVLGATFWGALQYITQSGWSSGFVRIHQAIGNFIPVIGILMIPIMIFGLHELYHWAHHDAINDPLIAHKSSYLNIPFFVARYIVFFAIWIFFTRLLRRYSLKEDQTGGLTYFHKMEFLSKVYIFVLALTFSLSSFDWIMSIDVHWWSTIFAVRNFVMAFYHGTVVIVLVVILLNKAGYLPFLNKNHLKDFSKYIFILSIIWVYVWFVQYILIWYANIPEETIYYMPRTMGEFSVFFRMEMIINWLVPFLLLLSKKIATNKNALLAIAIILIIGQWIDIYQQIFPGTVHHFKIGFIEIGMFIGYVGLFALGVAYSLKKTALVAKNHPYLEECLQHHG